MLLMDGDLILERMVAAVDKVRDRLRRATDALERSGVAYAVVGGNAVATWVARVDESAVRNTQDVDILLRRDDLPDARAALENEGFVYRHVAGMDIFLDGDSSKVRDAVHILFAGEKVRPEDILPSPDVTEAEKLTRFKVLSLEALVRVKLNVFRRKDQVHLGDLLDIGLIDETWKARYPPELAERLQLLIDTPEG
jgi:hypothetical protein